MIIETRNASRRRPRGTQNFELGAITTMDTLLFNGQKVKLFVRFSPLNGGRNG